jgi:hypothetical protein
VAAAVRVALPAEAAVKAAVAAVVVERAVAPTTTHSKRPPGIVVRPARELTLASAMKDAVVLAEAAAPVERAGRAALAAAAEAHSKSWC